VTAPRRAPRVALGAIAFVVLLLSAASGRARAEEPAAARGGEAAEKAGAPEGVEAGVEPEAPHLDGGKLGLQLLNFGVLAVILGWFGGKALNKSLLARHEQLKIDLASAAEARAAAERRVADQDKRLTTLETEIEAIRTGIRAEAEAEKQRLIAAAEERARGIAHETTFLLDQQVKAAEASLKREVAEAAVKIAAELVARSLDARDQQRLLDTFVTDVATVSPATGGGA
jgi:F-type H+-transporting ATPase subunit b